jgi:exopolysaccharide production protein ExoZ
VDHFFVISGFIMAVTSLGSTQGPWHFWRRRFIRVVPLYWVLTFLMVSIWFLKPALFKTLSPSWSTLAQSLLFIPHFSVSFPDEVWPLLVPGWSLNYEMFFYAVFGFCLALPVRLRVVALSLFFLALVFAGYAFAPVASAAQRVYLSPLLLEFLFGVWIGTL